jgi:hypothetical protein
MNFVASRGIRKNALQLVGGARVAPRIVVGNCGRLIDAIELLFVRFSANAGIAQQKPMQRNGD